MIEYILTCIMIIKIFLLLGYFGTGIVQRMPLVKCIRLGKTIMTFSGFFVIIPYAMLMATGVISLLLNAGTDFFDVAIWIVLFCILFGCLVGFFINGIVWMKDNKLHFCQFPYIHKVVSFEELQMYAKEVKPFCYQDKMIIFAAERTIILSMPNTVGGFSFINVLFHRLNWELPKFRPDSIYHVAKEEKSATVLYEYVQKRRK